MTSPTANPDLVCHICGTPWIVLGLTECARREAIAAWQGCCVEPARIVRIPTPVSAALGKPASRDHAPAADPTPPGPVGGGLGVAAHLPLVACVVLGLGALTPLWLMVARGSW